MKNIFYLFLAGFSISSYAQPTISSSIAGGIGDEFSSTMVTTEDFDPGAAGAGVTWDFSGITTSGTVNEYTLIDPSETGHAGDFPGANVSSDDGSGSYGYYKISSSEYTIYGLYTPATTIFYSDPEEVYVFPLTYGTTNSDDLHAEFFNGSDFIRDGSNELNADGYGTLQLPSGTYTNVLRVKVEEDYTDEVVGLPYTFEYNFDSYYWLKEGVKGPLFQYAHLEVTISGSTTLTESYAINNNTEVTSVEDGSIPAAIYVFPNPAVDYFTVKAPGMEQLALFNALGQLVFSQLDINADIYTVDVNHLPAGVYMAQIKTQNGTVTSKIRIQ